MFKKNTIRKRLFWNAVLLFFILLSITPLARDIDGSKHILDSLNQRLNESINDSSEKLHVLNTLSMSYWKVSPDSSIYYGKQALKLVENLQNENEKADVFHNLGVAYFYRNSFETSLEYLYKSLELREKKNDPYKVGTTLNSIGNIYYALNNVDKALEFYNRSLELIRKSENKKMEASILINIGSLYVTLGEMQNAFELLNYSVELHEKLNDSIGLSSALNNLAMAHRENLNYDLALECDIKALNISTKMGRLWDISYISNTLGETYLLKNNFEMANHYFKQALQIAEKTGSKDILLFSYRSLTKYYSKMVDYKRFDDYFKKYDALKDTIFTTENTRSIAEMQVKYETEHKEKENALQKLQIAKERSLRNSFIYISIIVLIVVVILFFRYRNKKRINTELESLVKLRTKDLLNNQIKLKEAQRIGRSGGWDWDLLNNKMDWSDEVPKIIGISSNELNSTNLFKRIHTDDRQALLKIFRREFDQFADIIFDFRLVNNGKIEKYLSVHGEFNRNEAGQPILLQGTIQDITERKQAELALRESEELYRKLISASPDAVFEISTPGIIVFASQQSKSLLRTSDVDSIIGTNFIDWIASSDRNRIFKNIKSLFNDVNERDMQYVLQRKDGSTFSGELKTAVIYDTEGNAKGLIAVARNITNRKMLEQRILRNTIETEERERARFSEDLHDGLGPLLSTVKIHLELITARKGNPSEQEKFIKMTDDLLQEAIKSTREIANNITPNLLNDFGLIEALAVYVEKINKTNTIIIHLEVEDFLQILPKQTEVALYRVICELINNTIKHASATNITISLKTIEKHIIIRYADNGIGFDIQKMLSTRSKGLGLSNIISRIKSVNGVCNFHSEPGRNFISIIEVGIPDDADKDIVQIIS